MSSCFCHIPTASIFTATTEVSLFADVIPDPLLPVAMPVLQMAAELASVVPPTGPYIQPDIPDFTEDLALVGELIDIADLLNILPGTFSIMDPLKLEEELKSSAESLGPHAPYFSTLADMDLDDLLQVADLARLVVDLRVSGFDPANPSFPALIQSQAAVVASFPAPVLPAPEVARLRLVAKIPTLISACETLNIPSATPVATQTILNTVAKVKPPEFPLPLPDLLQAAVAIEALSIVQLAFGPGLPDPRAIQDLLQVAVSTNLVIDPTPPELVLPPIAEIELGAKLLAGPAATLLDTPINIPDLPALAPISTVMALRASATMQTKLPIENLCLLCGGGFR